MTPLPILLYDGPCVLCQQSVRFILRREREPRLSFASLDSELGRELQAANGIGDDVDAVILVEESGATLGSDAAFRVCGYLKYPWRLFHPLRHLPSPPFQGLYRFIAKRRIRWFGRTEACPLPEPDQANRFLT